VGAPDITAVNVTSYEGGGVSFTIAIADKPEFATDMLVRTYLDTDKNVETGNAKGFDYMIQSQRAASSEEEFSLAQVKCENQPTTSLLKWNGSAWEPVKTESLSAWYGDSSLTIQLNSSEIADALAFNFAVYAAANVTYDESGNPVLDSAVFDWAPNEGSYVYSPLDFSIYADPVGDGSGEGAPDITKVVVTKWRSGQFKFWIEIPKTEWFAEDMLVRTYVDSDSNSETGDANGYEYLIQAQRSAVTPATEKLAPRSRATVARARCYELSLTVLKWDGSAWALIDEGSTDGSYNHGLKFALDASSIGDVKAFSFAVSAAAKVSFDAEGNPNLTDAVSDRAPNTGSYNFPLVVSSAKLLGAYKVRYKVKKARNFADLKRGTTFTKTWKFVRSCKKKTCVTRVVVVGGSERFKLARKGRTLYKAKAGRKFACEAGSSARGTQKVQIRLKRGVWVKGKWRVAKWVGTVRVVSPNNHNPQCGGKAYYTASLTGKHK
jgi:hypothetical protein